LLETVREFSKKCIPDLFEQGGLEIVYIRNKLPREAYFSSLELQEPAGAEPGSIRTGSFKGIS